MTLILSLGNQDQVIQISDRRHTVDGRVVSDERNKATIMTCVNARLAVGFTGIATAAFFDAQEWLLRSLCECGPPDFTAKRILDRLCAKATEDFRSHQILRRLPREKKRFSVMFSGYLDHLDPPLCAFALLSNYQDFVYTKTDSEECWEEFKIVYCSEKRPDGVPLDDLSMVQRIGTWENVWRVSDEWAVRPILVRRMHGEAIVVKGCALVREIARRSKAGNLIGQQLTWIEIPRDPARDIVWSYDTGVPTNTMYAPDIAALHPRGSHLIRGFAMEKDTTTGPHPERPAFVPRLRADGTRLRADQRCPCGSGRRYKACHGMRDRDHHP